MKDCCSPRKENPKKDLYKSEESCCTPREKDKKTMEEKENGCNC